MKKYINLIFVTSLFFLRMNSETFHLENRTQEDFEITLYKSNNEIKDSITFFKSPNELNDLHHVELKFDNLFKVNDNENPNYIKELDNNTIISIQSQSSQSGVFIFKYFSNIDSNSYLLLVNSCCSYKGNIYPILGCYRLGNTTNSIIYLFIESKKEIFTIDDIKHEHRYINFELRKRLNEKAVA